MSSVIASMGGFIVSPTDTSSDLGKLFSNFDQVILPALQNVNGASQLVRLDGTAAGCPPWTAAS